MNRVFATGVPYFEIDRLLAPIRHDPGFAQLLDRGRERQAPLRTAFGL